MKQSGIVNRVGRFLFGYDAVESKNRRQAPTGRLRSEDKELLAHQRRKLTSASRDIHRNFTIAGWAIRKHLDYVSTFSFQSRTGNPDLDTRIEALMDWWSRPANSDVAGRHSLPRLVRLAEERRTVDGDVFFLKLSDGRLQAIEGDRVQTPTSGLPQGVLPAEFVHGVRVDEAGKALGYAVCKRPVTGGDLAFERLVPAAFVVHHAFFDRFDQVRGISPLAAARDVVTVSTSAWTTRLSPGTGATWETAKSSAQARMPGNDPLDGPAGKDYGVATCGENTLPPAQAPTSSPIGRRFARPFPQTRFASFT